MYKIWNVFNTVEPGNGIQKLKKNICIEEK